MICDRCDEPIPGLFPQEHKDYFRSFDDNNIQTLWYPMMRAGEEIICRNCAGNNPQLDLLAFKRRMEKSGHWPR